MKGPGTYNGYMTTGSCYDFCGKQGYAYAGLENGLEVSDIAMSADRSAIAAQPNLHLIGKSTMHSAMPDAAASRAPSAELRGD
jgi:hypothetical protein